LLKRRSALSNDSPSRSFTSDSESHLLKPIYPGRGLPTQPVPPEDGDCIGNRSCR
jgi:hypothetical protein